MPNLENKLPIAVEAHSHLELPADHASTAQFMLLQPMFYRHTLRTENNHFQFTSKIKPNPIVVPTFGRIRQNLRHFFVPYRLVFPNWEEFKQDVIASNYDYSSQVSSAPRFRGEEILNMFINVPGLVITVPQPTFSPQNFDFVQNSVYYQFTRLGRYFYKILYSLGYELVPPSRDFYYNALALLAYARCYCDWYANDQYLTDPTFLTLQRMFKYNDPTAPLELSYQDIYDILLFIRPALYESNFYFEKAWDNPISPNNGQFTSFTFADPTSNNGSVVSTNTNGTPEMYQSSASSTSLGSGYLHQVLDKLSDYQRRHALSGAHVIDRVLAEYGIKTDYLRTQRSIYCGVSSFDVEINTIFATADGVNANGQSTVGDYAGAAIGNGHGVLDYQNDEEGIFISISTIQPSGGYYQGYDRNNRHLTKEQFYTPSFDSLGVQSIEKGEVYVSKDLDNFAVDAIDYAGHFGFSGRYAEYKRSINRVSGDLALPSAIQGGDSWHLMREFNDTYFNGSVNNIVHNEDFCRGTDALQYLRLFTYSGINGKPDSVLDPFNLFLHVECSSYSPCHPAFDYDWDSDSPTIHINSAGPKVN